MLFNVRGDMDRFDIFKIGETGSLAPVQELADCLIVGGPSVFVADRNREEFKVVASGPTSAMIAGTWNDSAL
jgi:hypothetical protein